MASRLPRCLQHGLSAPTLTGWSLPPRAGDLANSLAAAGQEVPQALVDLAKIDSHFRKGLGGGRRGGGGARPRQGPRSGAGLCMRASGPCLRASSMLAGALIFTSHPAVPLLAGPPLHGCGCMLLAWLRSRLQNPSISVSDAGHLPRLTTSASLACQVGGAGLGFGQGHSAAATAGAATAASPAPNQATPARAAQASFESGFARGGLESTIEGTDPRARSGAASAGPIAAAAPAQPPLPPGPPTQNGSAAPHAAAMPPPPPATTPVQHQQPQGAPPPQVPPSSSWEQPLCWLICAL